MIDYDYIEQGDCLELMKEFPDNSIDLIVTDPPYGKKADKGTNGFGTAKNRRYQGGWDTHTHPIRSILMKCLELVEI